MKLKNVCSVCLLFFEKCLEDAMRLRLSGWKRLTKFSLLTAVSFAITGCAEAATIIVVPAATSGVVYLLWYFVIAGVVSTCEPPRKTITPEQAQQQQIAMQNQVAEQKHQEEMDLPAGLTPSSKNFVRVDSSLTSSTLMVESRTLSSNHNFQVYYKSSFRGSEWQRAELVSMYVDNPDNLENLVNRRLLFNVKENISVYYSKVIVTWDN